MTPSNPNPLKRGSSRGISLSGRCTGKSLVKPTLPSKRGMRATTTRNVSECADVKCSDKIKKGVRSGWNATSSLPVFQTSSQRGLFKYFEKVSSESHVTQERWGRWHLWKKKCGNIRIHSHHIHFTRRQRVSRSTILSKNVKSPKDGSNPKLPYKGSSRGVEIELLWHDNKVEISIPDWSWKGVRIWFLYTNIYVLQDLSGMFMSN